MCQIHKVAANPHSDQANLIGLCVLCTTVIHTYRHHLLLLLITKAGTHFIHMEVEGLVDLGTVVRMCSPYPRLHVTVAIVINIIACQENLNWDPLTLQSGMLSLDHCNLILNGYDMMWYRFFVNGLCNCRQLGLVLLHCQAAVVEETWVLNTPNSGRPLSQNWCLGCMTFLTTCMAQLRQVCYLCFILLLHLPNVLCFCLRLPEAAGLLKQLRVNIYLPLEKCSHWYGGRYISCAMIRLINISLINHWTEYFLHDMSLWKC